MSIENGNMNSKLHQESHQDTLAQIKSAGSIAMPPELFEKLYLQPQTRVKGVLRQTLGNPTPIGIIGFIMSLGPLSCDLMGWRGAGGGGASGIPAYLFFGGILMLVAGILEFILGNSFSSIVFATYGAFWLTFGGTQLPQLNAYVAYAPPDAASPAAGLETTGFNAGFGFFTLSMTMISFVYLLCSFRVNVVFVVKFLSLTLAFGFVTGAYWLLAMENAAGGAKFLLAAGAAAFVTTACGWWLLVSMLLAILEFPFGLPVGDLSTLIKGSTAAKNAV